jgi:lipid-A-disaccharide synthase
VATSLDTELQLVMPAANQSRYQQLQKITAHRPDNIRLLKQQSYLAMEAADVVLLTSGTTALEAMLLKKPMVVGYRMGALTYRLLSPLIKTPFVSIPNLLADKLLVPELIQSHATVEALSQQLVIALQSDNGALVEEFDKLHQQLAVNSGEIAATAIADLLVGE